VRNLIFSKVALTVSDNAIKMATKPTNEYYEYHTGTYELMHADTYRYHMFQVFVFNFSTKHYTFYLKGVSFLEGLSFPRHSKNSPCSALSSKLVPKKTG